MASPPLSPPRSASCCIQLYIIIIKKKKKKKKKEEETVTRHSKETTTTTTTSMAAKGQQAKAAKKTQETEVPFPSYDDFEPLCTWRREEDKDTLVVHLPEFKVDELKVLISNRGNMKISGERPTINGKGRARFTKEMKNLKNYDASKITAKFTKDGLLHVTLPKKIPKSESSEADARAADLPKVGGEGGRAGTKVALSVAVVVAAAAALAVGAYAIFKRGTSSSKADSTAAQRPVSSNK